MSCDGDRLLPVSDTWLNAFYNDRRAEYGSVKHRTDRTVGALPHFFQIIFSHACRVWGDGRTFHRYSVFHRGIGRINRYLVIGFISMLQSQVVVLGLQVNKRKKKFVLDHFPENTGHLVSIHLDQRGRHLNFFHNVLLG